MRLVKLKYGRDDEVSYWLGLSLGQGEPPRGPSLSHVKCMRWMGSRLNGKKTHDILGVVVSHSWIPFKRCVVPSSAKHFFQAHHLPFIFLSLYFLS
jgi:hypothetical protein